MRHFIKTFSKADYLCLAICFCVYLLLAFQSIPYSNDDYLYHFHQGTNQVIASFSELIDSNIHGYTYNNGRFLAHVVVQIFQAWNLRTLFVITSAIAFLFFVWSMIYIVRRNGTYKGDGLYILFFLIAFWPLAASTLYGSVALTVNYLWSAAIYMFFLAVYFHVKEDNVDYPLWQLSVLSLFGLICGSWQESFGIGIGGAICLYHLFNLRRTNKSTYALIIGFGIGLCILIFAPGNFMRVDETGGDFIGMKKFISQIIQLCKHNLFVDVWILIGIISVIIDGIRKDYFAFIKTNWFFFLSAVISFVFTLYTLAFGMMQGIWQLTFLGVIDTILMIKFFRTYMLRLYQSTSVTALLVAAMCIFIGSVYGYRHVLKVEKQSLTHELYEQQSDTVYDGRLQYTIQHLLPTHNDFMYDHICDMYCSFYSANTLNNMLRVHSNGQDLRKVVLMPEPAESIIANCIESNEVSPNVYLAPLQYYIVRILKEEVENASLVLSIEKKELRTKRYTETYPVFMLKCVEDSNYVYGVKTFDWWRYHHCVITNAELRAE